MGISHKALHFNETSTSFQVSPPPFDICTIEDIKPSHHLSYTSFVLHFSSIFLHWEHLGPQFKYNEIKN